jgi:hypothetical protein
MLPNVGTMMDFNPALAEETRKDALRQAAEEGPFVAGIRMVFSGLAQLKSDSDR